MQTLAPSAWTCDARDLARVIEDGPRPAATVLGVGEGDQQSPGLRVLCVRPPVPLAGPPPPVSRVDVTARISELEVAFTTSERLFQIKCKSRLWV